MCGYCETCGAKDDMAAEDGCGSRSYEKFKIVLHGAYRLICLICVVLQKVQNPRLRLLAKLQAGYDHTQDSAVKF